ncbi:hypothetical protein EVAR_85201_1 [Eumeta japonica]|uniref:Uncharacterized protein n=1 Tax=Eumeta variegata TaxID=151549 RepID=A0A4C1W1Q4_EUMVA|nr:hypothetical protein EVAR_85201_1 [Eumeta japonica]
MANYMAIYIEQRCKSPSAAVLLVKSRHVKIKAFIALADGGANAAERVSTVADTRSGNSPFARASASPSLRYFASGCSMVDLHNSFRVGMSTITEIIREVCWVLWTHQRKFYLPLATSDDRKKKRRSLIFEQIFLIALIPEMENIYVLTDPVNFVPPKSL